MKENKKKITIYDLAEITGFSVGTVYRALNGKKRIKEETRKLILETAEKVGYKANPAAQGLHRNQMRIGVVLYCQVYEYVTAIWRGVETAAVDLEKYNVELEVHMLPYTTNRECREKAIELIYRFEQENFDGIALFMSSTKGEAAEISKVIDEIAEKGIPVATIANDIPESRRVLHVGINAHMAGKMAAEMLWLLCPGKDVALLTNSLESEVNRQYVEGFHEFSGDNRFSSIRIYEHFDEPKIVIRQTERMIAENPSLSGIYMTSASATSACQHIRQMGKKDYKIITTDLLEETPQILYDGAASAAIFQDPFRQGRNAVKALYDYILTKKIQDDYSIIPSIILASNVSAYII